MTIRQPDHFSENGVSEAVATGLEADATTTEPTGVPAAPDRKMCFVIMPSGNHQEYLFEEARRPYFAN